MSPPMKRLAVSTRDSVPVDWSFVPFTGGPVSGGRSREVLPAFCSRSSRTSPPSPSAQEGIRSGSAIYQRPCNGGQGNIRAHPPIEPARDQGPPRQGGVDSVSHPRGRQQPARDDEDAERAGARTRCHRAAGQLDLRDLDAMIENAKTWPRLACHVERGRRNTSCSDATCSLKGRDRRRTPAQQPPEGAS
jgi:hypothetical protein